MRLIVLFLLPFLGSPLLCHASTSWAGPYSSYINGVAWRVTFDWGINLDGAADTSPVQCSADLCYVLFGTRSGVVPPWPGTCDSGGVCAGQGVATSGSKYVAVRRGVSWDEAYRTFAAKYGTSGFSDQAVLFITTIPPSWHPTWGVLCVGFIAVGSDQTRGPAVLAPSTTCGTVNRPDLKCDLDLDPVYDFGVINTGTHDIRTAEGHMNVRCTGDATISVSLTRTHQLAGVPLYMEINGIQMNTTKKEVYHGRASALPVRFHLVGDAKSAGQFQESVPVIVSYY